MTAASLGFAAWLGIFIAIGTALATSDGSITGVVTDAAGKPAFIETQRTLPE